jgi:methylenetetrahydrofolate dehydrogenase (NADP+) / methenyltetrahydrofolate cyclohydrolase
MAGANAVVLGRSNIVGKPTALLLGKNSSVTLVHSKSRNLPALLPQADILVAAVAQLELVRGDWIKLDAIVVDVDPNRLTSPNGTSKLIGDAAFYDAQGVAAAITPVPGGVGPTTIAYTVIAACRRHHHPKPRI